MSLHTQELIDSLNSTEAERVRWMTAALTAGNEIATLKAQVNCLRKAIMAASVKGVPSDLVQVFHEALEATKEQCLAEVKAKAIEDASNQVDCVDGVCELFELWDIAKQLREQAK